MFESIKPYPAGQTASYRKNGVYFRINFELNLIETENDQLENAEIIQRIHSEEGAFNPLDYY